ncbi:MarR family winged helix-turn-helix transcriptional regulator [Billgrantia gudaonensis]|uniref:MarR family winged helix-turn-helix transcriptional regulator n=1 Tax=Billgrantia gudaonensis TaxID=376427 RepID=UPI00115F9943|nr:MarR family winged helix-turn-helix transcriptional regulator [Halomonas gudaonensis]
MMEHQKPKLSLNEKISMRRILGVAQEFRELQSDFPLQIAALFAYVAANPGISMDELRERTNTKQSTCSRSISVLSEWQEYDKRGFGLVWTEEDPTERRRNLVPLTEKGEELAATLSDIVR